MKNIINIANGFKNIIKKSNEEVSKERMEVCKGCHISANTNWCKRDNGGCGCFLPSKTRVIDEKCPKGKW